MSPLLREIVREALDREPDIDIVGDHDVAADLRAAVEEDGADFVIIGSIESEAVGVRSFAATFCGVRVLELRSDGRESVLHELRPHRVALGELSRDTLLRTIRATRDRTAAGQTEQTSEQRPV